MIDICCIGHITADTVVTPNSVNYLPGGTAYYFSNALSKLDVQYLLVTSLSFEEGNYVAELRKNGIKVNVQYSANTVHFENIYGDNPDQRTQYVTQKASPFTFEQMAGVEAGIYHLGPLLADDIPTEFIKMLAASKGRISLDVQGYLRNVNKGKVYPTDWGDKRLALPYIDILKADEAELRLLTGYADVDSGAKQVADWGVNEVVVTNGSSGSVIYSNGTKEVVPAYTPKVIADTTGCGDTYMAGYLYRSVKGYNIAASGRFAAAMAGLKTQSSGPYRGGLDDVIAFLQGND